MWNVKANIHVYMDENNNNKRAFSKVQPNL